MKLKTFKREDLAKSSINKIRREGNIPAVIYSKGKQGLNIVIDGQEFRYLLQTIKKGTLATKTIELTGEGFHGKVIIKDIQYHVARYDVMHLDFLEIRDDVLLTVNVPIDLIRSADCEGVKAGGVLRQVIRKMKVRCLPHHIPAGFELDVKQLGMKQSLRLKELKLPEGVHPMASLNEVAVVVTKR